MIVVPLYLQVAERGKLCPFHENWHSLDTSNLLSQSDELAAGFRLCQGYYVGVIKDDFQFLPTQQTGSSSYMSRIILTIDPDQDEARLLVLHEAATLSNP